jgi:hypothetical protein
MHLPLLDSTRAREELSWSPRHPAAVLDEFIDGLHNGAGSATAPLAPDSVSLRLKEVRTGIGARDS